MMPRWRGSMRASPAPRCRGKANKRGQRMPSFAANLTMMFNEVPFLDRFEAASAAGFSAVEFLFPYEHPPEVISERLQANGLTLALFNLPPGDWQAGERGLATLPERRDEFRI